ncbi:MAG TPA: hypothetical protein EYP35_01565 [Desulfobacterales bacterium]|nr:hypothetical protein [Desulfobacterales bacterium]
MNKDNNDSTNPKIFKATNVRNPHQIYYDLAGSLAHIDILQFIKIYNGRICASNLLSTNKKKKQPITKIGQEGVVGVELLIHPDHKSIDFYSLTSSQKGYGRKIVKSIVDATPEDWTIVVTMDWSGGFWQRMIEEYPQIVVL